MDSLEFNQGTCFMGCLEWFQIFNGLFLVIDQILFTSLQWKSDSVTDNLVLSNPAGTWCQNVFCLGLCGKDICTKSYA